MTNPYSELSAEQMQEHLVEINAEWRDVCNRQAELSEWAKVVQEHRGQLLKAMGIGIFPVRVQPTDTDDPLATPLWVSYEKSDSIY